MKLLLHRIVSGRRSSVGRASWLLAAVTLLAGATSVSGQLPGIREWDDGVKYARGQNVVPVFEGWVTNPDGTFSLVFGYFNRNWEESVFIPVGPDNKIEPGDLDRGQPTAFSPRRDRNKFEIVVPKDFGNKEVVWSLTSRGKTEKAFGVLVGPQVLTRRMVLANTGRDFSDDDTGDEQSTNVPATIAIDPVATVTRSQTASVTATVTDDGTLPRGYAFGRRSAREMRVVWTTYRGPAMAEFAPGTSTLEAKGGKTATSATFPVPGNYTLRATVTDVGGYVANKDVTVVVN
jgi:hypothetical protein